MIKFDPGLNVLHCCFDNGPPLPSTDAYLMLSIVHVGPYLGMGPRGDPPMFGDIGGLSSAKGPIHSDGCQTRDRRLSPGVGGDVPVLWFTDVVLMLWLCFPIDNRICFYLKICQIFFLKE